jgi:uroporphyrinogen decarboxylase
MAEPHPFLAACRREKTSYTPVWLMRQAGRYMEEYRKLRAEFSFLELCKRSDLAAEITVAPVDKLGVDAAILFADILLVLEPMGLGLEYSKDDGPVIRAQIRSRTDVEELNDFEPQTELSYVFETVRKARAALDGKVPLIGFAGAPFTLASYIVEGGGSRNYLKTKKLIYSDPGAWKALMEPPAPRPCSSSTAGPAACRPPIIKDTFCLTRARRSPRSRRERR